MFVLVDVCLWFLVFALGVAPAVVTFLTGRLRRWSGAVPAAVMVGLVGVAAAVALRGFLATYPTTWLIYVWTFAVPAGLIAVFRRRQHYGGRLASLGGLLAIAGVVGGSVTASAVGFPWGGSLLVLVAAGIPSALYADRVLRDKQGRAGLLAPLLLVGGALLGNSVVTWAGFAAPDPWLDWSYLTSAPSRTAAEAGLYPAIVGSIFVIGLVALLSFALGVGTAVFLKEYSADSGLMGGINRLIRINIANGRGPGCRRLHRRCGGVVAILEYDAGAVTGDDHDAVLYRVQLDDGTNTDVRWRDLRPP
jgi:phosphate transport system permease protein